MTKRSYKTRLNWQQGQLRMFRNGLGEEIGKVGKTIKIREDRFTRCLFGQKKRKEDKTSNSLLKTFFPSSLKFTLLTLVHAISPIFYAVSTKCSHQTAAAGKGNAQGPGSRRGQQGWGAQRQQGRGM